MHNPIMAAILRSTTDTCDKNSSVNSADTFCLALHVLTGGPGSSVGIAIGYGLDGPGIESRWGREFPHLSRSSLGPTQPPVQ